MILRNPSLRRDFLFVACSLFILLFSAPVFSQGIIGYVREETSHQPVENAVVNILLHDSIISSLTTDDEGRYEFHSGIAGNVDIDIRQLGYIQTIVTNISLDGYTTHRLEHLIPLNIIALDMVSTVAPRETSFIKITPEDLKNTAANYDDPVRVAVSEPGIVQINDQANHISVRGQNPIFNTWYLEGLEIVNPNHTNNAGTFSDQPVQSGGGVNMFSAQTLGHTDIHTGINPLSIGRSAGAVIDMHLHETVKPELRLKAGFLGFEAGGGKALGKNGILDVNFRYSFTGLLADLGVDFGGEKIGFYDGVIAYTHLTSRHKLKVFAWGGRSENIFERVPVDEEKVRYKDFFDINYENNIFGTGLRYTRSLSQKVSFNGGAAYSELNTEYDKTGYFSPFSEILNLEERTRLITTFVELSHYHSTKLNSTFGIQYTNKLLHQNETIVSPFVDESFLRPYLELQLGNSLSTFLLEAGIEFNFSQDDFWEPGYRAIGHWRVNDQLNVFAGARQASGQYVQRFGYESPESPLIINKYEIGAGFNSINNSFSLKTYLQEINNLPVFFTDTGFIHLADQSDPIIRSAHTTDYIPGEGKYTGIEADWKFRSNTGWKIGINQTIYKSIRNIRSIDNDSETGKYDGQYASHITLAKEIYKARKEKNRIWNFSLRGILNGGLRAQTIDIDASQELERTVFSSPGGYHERLPAYKRVDASISRTIANEKAKWRIALDIQNVLNMSNVAYQYYDPFLGRIETQEQLGIIPVFSVQVSW